MLKKLLITGGAGRLGSRLVRAALRKGYDVAVLTLDAKAARKTFKGDAVKIFEGDLLRMPSQKLREAVRGRDVLHLAGRVDFHASKQALWGPNVEATRRIVLAAEAEGVKRFVHMSSTSIYHHPPYLPIDERQLPSPSKGYGETKLAAEGVVSASSLDYAMVRAPAIYGPGFTDGFFQVIALLKKGKMIVVGDGKNHIPLIHVDDVVRALLLALGNRKISRDAFIVSSGEALTQEQTLKIVAEELGVPAPSKHVPIALAYVLAGADFFRSLFGARRKLLRSYIRFLAEDRTFDISKAKKYGFRPAVGLKEGARALIKSERLR